MNKNINTDEITNLIKIFVALILIFVIFLGLTYLRVNNKELVIPSLSYDETIQYEEILVGEILTQKESEYYVLVTSEDDYNVNTYNAYFETLPEEDNVTKYNVNLDLFLNKNHLKDESNIEKLIFSQTTLLKVKDGQVDLFKEGKEEIVEQLKEMTSR